MSGFQLVTPGAWVNLIIDSRTFVATRMQAFLSDHGIVFSLGLGLAGLAAAILLIRIVIASPAGNPRMTEIAKAVQEGAKAYLQRQVGAISWIAAIIFIGIGLLGDGRPRGDLWSERSARSSRATSG